MKLLRPLALVVSVFVMQVAAAQDLCGPLLQHGIYDSFRERTDQANSQLIDREVCDAYSSLKNSSNSASGSASYAGFGAKFGMSNQQLDVIGKNRCEKDYSATASKELIEKAGRYISEPAVEAWKDCTQRVIAAQKNGGLVVDTTYLGEELGGSGLTIGLRNAPAIGSTSGTQTVLITRIETFPRNSLICSGPLVESLNASPAGVQLGYSIQAFQCTRDLNKEPVQYAGRRVLAVPSSVTIYTAADTVVRKLSLVPAYPPLIPYGVGDIVSSSLTLEQFTITHGTGWRLANGGAVPGTAYSRVTGLTTVPDLRGVFLRGRNYDRRLDMGDPAGDKPVGTYEADELKKHAHKIEPRPMARGAPLNPEYDLATTANLMGRIPETEPFGGNETRPRSVVVNFFIKVD